MRLRAVEAEAGLKRSALYEKIKQGKFPAPVKLSPRCSVWVKAEVSDWKEQQVANRDAALAAAAARGKAA